MKRTNRAVAVMLEHGYVPLSTACERTGMHRHTILRAALADKAAKRIGGGPWYIRAAWVRKAIEGAP